MSKHFFQKKLLPLALTASMMLSATPVLAAPNDLAGHWAEKVVTAWQEKGWVKGYADGTFKPNNNITRAEFTVLVNQKQGFADAAEISFADVAEGDWFYATVAKAVAAGYTKGYNDNTFRPNQTITRAEAAVMMANAAGLTAGEAAPDFKDAAAIPAWAQGSVAAAVAAGFMSGYPDGSFKANASITRAEAISALDRLPGAEAPAAPAETPVSDDFIITEAGTTVENETISGDLIVEESVGDGNVYLKNVTVEGDTFIKGGGSHSVYAENSKFGGTVYMQKSGLHLGISGSTEIGDMQMEQPGSVTFDQDFSGSVKTLSIPEGAPEGKYSIEAEDKNSTPVENVNVDAKADLSLGANISKMTIGAKAEDSSITVEKDSTVDSMEVNSKVDVDGKGTVDSMEVSASGVTTDKDLTVNDTTTSNGASAPTTPATKPSGSSSGGSSSGGSSSGGSSTTPTKPTVTITPRIINLQNTTDAIFDADAAVTADDLKISVVKGGTVLENGTDYDLTISTGSASASICISFKAALEKDISYQVTIEPSSVGAGKYSITKTTTELATPKTLVWNATSTGIESIIHNTAIPENGAKVTFTVTGATFNSDSGNIGATLQENSPGAEEIIIDSSKITSTNGGNTITVSLAGKSLSVGQYTLTLSVDKNRLNLIVPYVADELSETTATITVAAKPAALGDPSSSEPLEFTSGLELPTCNISFPATGIASLSTEGTPTATISPEASNITTNIYASPDNNNVQNVVVGLTGTAPTVDADTEYTLTLTIPKEDITPKDGYNAPEDLTKTFTFMVKAASSAPTTTPVTAEGNGDTVILTAGDTIPAGKTITVTVTGASALTTSGIQVIAFQGGNSVEINSTAAFTAPTEGNNTGTLVLTLSGTAPTISDTELSSGSNGLKVVIPKDNITAMSGYTAPTDDITINDFKFVLNSAPTGGE